MLDLARGTATIMFVCVAVAAAAVTVAVVALPNRRALPTVPRIVHPINCKAHASSLIRTTTKATTTCQRAKNWMICAKEWEEATKPIVVVRIMLSPSTTSCRGVTTMKQRVPVSRPIATKRRTKRHATVLVSKNFARIIYYFDSLIFFICIFLPLPLPLF